MLLSFVDNAYLVDVTLLLWNELLFCFKLLTDDKIKFDAGFILNQVLANWDFYEYWSSSCYWWSAVTEFAISTYFDTKKNRRNVVTGQTFFFFTEFQYFQGSVLTRYAVPIILYLNVLRFDACMWNRNRVVFEIWYDTVILFVALLRVILCL